MSLERTQALHNSFISNAGNVSGSNDPAQKPNDANELLIKGASAAAAGRELGLSEEETLAAVSRQFRRQRRADDRVTQDDVLRQLAQSAATVREDVGSPEIRGVTYQNDDEIDAVFGKTDYEMGLRDLDADNGVNSSAPEPEIRGTRRYGSQPSETIQNPVRPQEDPFYKGDVAPNSVLRDALSRLQTGTSQYGYDTFPGSADVAGRLETNVNLDRGADAALGAEAVRRDSRRFNPEMIEYNDNRAEAESQSIARELFGGYGSGSMADDSIGRIAEIRSLGKIGETAHVVRTANDAIKGQVTRRHDGVFLDPVSGDPVAVQGPELAPVLAGDRTPNNGSTSDSLNAPQTAREWATGMLDRSLEFSGNSDRIPQVDITTATTTFANKVRDYYQKAGLGTTARVPANVRSIDELQRVVQRVSDASGGRLMMADPENPGQQIPAGRNVVDGALQSIGMTQLEQSQLGQALYQLDAAQRSSVNQNPTGIYLSRSTKQGPKLSAPSDVFFDAADAIDPREGQAKVARVPRGSTISVSQGGSTKPVRKSIVAELKGLPSEDAQRPFIGQVQGEKPRVNRFNRTGETEPDKIDSSLRVQAESRARRDRKPVDEASLRDRQTKAKLVQERENRDSRKREEQRKLIQEFTPANLRQRGRYS